MSNRTAILSPTRNTDNGKPHTNAEVMNMAKAGMRRPDPKEPHGTESNRKTHIPKNDVPPVPELQGKAKHGKEKAKPIHE
jgi:hypothetical protein